LEFWSPVAYTTKNMMIINDATSRSVFLELSIKLLEKTYNTGITHDNHHLRLLYFRVQATDVSKKVSKKAILVFQYLITIGLYHTLDGITNPKYKLLLFLTTIFFTKRRRH
jgi:hypothetical protein